MKMVTAARYAQSLEMSEAEFNDYLEELGYLQRGGQEEGRIQWIVTSEGEKHSKRSRNPFRRNTLWDFDAFFAVHKLRGKKVHRQTFCDQCETYMYTQPGFSFEAEEWTCLKCGYKNVISK